VIPKKVFAALACARAVVTADGAGIREALDPSTAYLCRAGDPDDLARTLRLALEDDAGRETIALRGRALHERCFTTEAVGATCRAALTEFVRPGRRARAHAPASTEGAAS
jgi:glycosyltransferase involved in cell wall biosynthesis